MHREIVLCVILGATLLTVSGLVLSINNCAWTVHAQTNLTNATTLPPVQMESVDPADNDDNNVTISGNADYLTYADSDMGFSIDYPSDWDVSDTDLTNNAVVAFAPPDTSVEVDIKSFARTDSMSLKTFGDTFFKNSDSFRLSAYYRNSTTLLGGEPAIRTIATFISSPSFYESLRGEESTTQKILAMTTLLKEKKSFLQVIFYADKSNFMDYLSEVEHMIKSLQFENTKPIIQED